MNKVRAKVLVIDDEPGMRDMLSFGLSSEGFEVETVGSGRDAVKALERNKFDLAVTDLKMQGMDGIATVEALKAIDPTIEVIVATGYATIENAVACMKRGAYDLVQKPYDLQALTVLLERAMEKSHLQAVITLYEVSEAIRSTLNQEALVQLVVEVTGRVMRSEVSCLALPARGGRELELHRPRSAPSVPESLARVLAERCQSLGTLVRLPAPDWAPAPEHELGPEFSGALAYPLTVHERSLGALVLFRQRGLNPFTTSEVQKGRIFATQIALALDNARVHKELADRLQELVSTRDKLVQAEKFALAGRLAGAVSHEINNPLAVVRANLFALRDYSTTVGSLWLAAKAAAEALRGAPVPGGPELATKLVSVAGSEEDTTALVRDVAAAIDESLDGVRRIADLVEGFHRLSQSAPPPAQAKVDVQEIVEDALAEFSPGAGSVRIIRELENGVGAVVDPQDLRTALLNVLLFLTERREQSADEPLVLRVRAHGASSCVEVWDRTLSLSAEERARLFEPRLQSSTPGRPVRIDLGLALAYQRVYRNGGDLVVHTENGGTAFQLIFPSDLQGLRGLQPERLVE